MSGRPIVTDQTDAPNRKVPLAAKVCEAISAVALLAMMLITVAEIIARTFGRSLQISEEYGGYLLVAITFLSIPAAFARSTFHHVEFIYESLRPVLRLAFNVAFLACSLIGCAIIGWELLQYELLSFRSGTTSDSILATPLWIPQLVMPVGVLVLCALMLRALILDVAALLRALARQGAARPQ